MRFQALFNFAIPGLILGLAALARSQLSQLDGAQLTLLSYAPYLLASLVAILAYQFNRSRYLLLAFLTAGSFWVIHDQLQVSLTEGDAERIYRALALTWPLSLLVLVLVPERGILNRWGFVYGLSLAVLGLAAPRLLMVFEAWLLDHPAWLSLWPTEYLVLPGYIAALIG